MLDHRANSHKSTDAQTSSDYVSEPGSPREVGGRALHNHIYNASQRVRRRATLVILTTLAETSPGGDDTSTAPYPFRNNCSSSVEGYIKV